MHCFILFNQPLYNKDSEGAKESVRIIWESVLGRLGLEKM